MNNQILENVEGQKMRFGRIIVFSIIVRREENIFGGVNRSLVKNVRDNYHNN